MTSEKSTSVTKMVMFISYPDGRVQTRFFADMSVLATWMRTMDTMKSLAAIEKYELFAIGEFPANAVVTTS